MLVFSCQMSFAGWNDDTKTSIIAKSDWSVPVSLVNDQLHSHHTNMNLSPVFRERDYKEKRTATLVFPKMVILPSEISGVEEMIERLPSRPERER